MDENHIKKDLILMYRKKNNLSIEKFCKLARIDKSVYYKIMSGKSNFYVIAIFRIAKLMGIEMKDLCDDKLIELNKNTEK